MLMLPVYLSGIVLLVVLVAYGTAISRMMSVRVRPRRRLRLVDSDEVPASIRNLLEEKSAGLTRLGFRACGYLAEDYLVEGVEEPSWSLLLLDSESTSIARLGLAESPTRVQPLDLTFYSSSEEGQLVETVAWRAHRLAPALPAHLLVDAETLRWLEHWDRHRAILAETPALVPVPLCAESFVAGLVEFRENADRFEIAQGRYLPRRDGGLRFSFGWALSTVLRANRGEGLRLKALAAESGRSPVGGTTSPGTESDLTPDLAAHRRREAIDEARRSSWLKKIVFFAVSMLLFSLAFGMLLSPRTLILILFALFFHELGHALAMHLFGYRDLQILFIPLLGAVASGRKENVSSLQEVVVLLAGPVPGILLGTLVLSTGLAELSPWLDHGAKLMLFLNYLNLLPIVPLDGGRVMSIVFFDRFPRLQFAFAASSAVSVIVLGLATEDWLIGGIGCALSMGVPRQLTQVRTYSRVRDALALVERGVRDPIRSIYAELQAAEFDRWNSEAKYQFVRHVLERIERRTANLRVAAASFVAYCAVVVLPVGYISYSYVPPPSRAHEAPAISLSRPASASSPIVAASAGEELAHLTLTSLAEP